MSVKVSARLSDELIAHLDALAKRDGVSRSKAIRSALEDFLGYGPAWERSTAKSTRWATPKAKPVPVASPFTPVAPSEPEVAVCGKQDPLSTSLRCVLEPGHGGYHTYH